MVHDHAAPVAQYLGAIDTPRAGQPRRPRGAHLFRRDDRPFDVAARVQANDTIVLVWLDRFSRNFDEGVRIQADLTSRNIGIVAIKEGIDTTDDSAAAKYFRRMMMANGAYQADSTSERIKVGQERAKAEGRPPGRPPALTPDQVNECKRMFAENPSVSRVARIMKISWSTANKAIFDESSAQSGMQ